MSASKIVDPHDVVDFWYDILLSPNARWYVGQNDNSNQLTDKCSKSHRAKTRRPLVERYRKHAVREEHWAKAGDTFLDPMCGSGSHVVMMAHDGLRTVGIDIESSCIQYASESSNILHSRHWRHRSIPQPIFRQGNSTNLVAALGDVVPRGTVKLILVSPGAGKYQTGGGIALEPGRQNDGYQLPDKTTYGNINNLHDGIEYNKVRPILIRQWFDILAPGGHLCILTRDFVRDWQMAPFSDDWMLAIEQEGFHLVCQHFALLEMKVVIETLDGEKVNVTSAKGLLRRIQESKGSPSLPYEVARCFQKPLDFTPNPKHY